MKGIDTMIHITAMKLALEALVMMDRTFDNSYNYRIEDEAKVATSIDALQSVLADPSAEPVAEVDVWVEFGRDIYELKQLSGFRDLAVGNHKLYTHPPVPYDPIGAWNKGFEEGKRLATPEPLTDAEVDFMVLQAMPEIGLPEGNPLRKLNAYRGLVRAGEAAIRSKA
jgi:hypothetical protein